MPLTINTTMGLRPYRAIVDSAWAVIWNPPSPQMTRGRLDEPNDAPTEAATEWPIDAHTASHRKASLPFTGRFAAAYVPRKVSGQVISVSSNALPTRWKTCL